METSSWTAQRKTNKWRRRLQPAWPKKIVGLVHCRIPQISLLERAYHGTVERDLFSSFSLISIILFTVPMNSNSISYTHTHQSKMQGMLEWVGGGGRGQKRSTAGSPLGLAKLLATACILQCSSETVLFDWKNQSGIGIGFIFLLKHLLQECESSQVMQTFVKADAVFLSKLTNLRSCTFWTFLFARSEIGSWGTDHN